MKLVFDNFDEMDERALKDFQESVAKAYAISKNAEDLMNYQDIKGVFSHHDIDTIDCYGDDYANEFYITMNKSVGSELPTNDRILYIEVLNEAEAEENEREYMQGNTSFTKEERENYKLGETVQWYYPLGDTGYWYCLK